MSARIVPEGLIQSSNWSPIEEINLKNVNENTLKGPQQITSKSFRNTTIKHFAVDASVLNNESKEMFPSLNESELEKLEAKLRREKNSAAKAFKMFDLNGDGTLAVSELTNVAETLSQDVGKDVIFKIIEQYDKDGDAVLTLDEFAEIFHRFNEERHAIHRAETELLKEQFNLNIKLSRSTKCAHACVGTAETAFCVYHKFLLMLASIALMALMIPLCKIAYQNELDRINGYMYAIVWSPFWVLYPTWTIVCYQYAYPKRQPVWLLVVLCLIYAAIGLANVSALACPNAAFFISYSSPSVSPFGYKVWRSVTATLLATVNFVLLFLYRGPVRFKALLAFTTFLMFFLPSPTYFRNFLGSNTASAILTLVVLFSVTVAIRITECLHKRKGGKRIGGSRAYTAMVALLLPNVVQGFTILVLYAFHELKSSPTMTLIFYLVFLMIKLQVRDALAIATSSSLPDDITTVVFMYFPIFAFQYITELMYLSTATALSVKFFILMALKIITGSLTKGGFLIRWAMALENWSQRKRQRHKARKTLIRGATDSRVLTRSMTQIQSMSKTYDQSSGNDSTSESTKENRRANTPRISLKKLKRDAACRQVELNCLWVIQQLVKILFSFLSNTSGQTLHEIEGMSEHQRMVQTTVVIFTLISMSNLSSLACNLGSIVVLIIEKSLPKSERVWFKGIGDKELATSLVSFSIVLAANIFIIFLSNWTKYSRWSQLQVLSTLSKVHPENVIRTQNTSIRRAKAKFLRNMHRKSMGKREHSTSGLLDAAHGSSRAATDEILVDAEYHGNKLYMLERQVFRKHFWLLLLFTMYATHNGVAYGIDKSYIGWIQSHHRAFNCNWTLVINSSTSPPPGVYSWANAPMCGTGELPNLNCTRTCAAAYPNSSYWAGNCSIY